MRGGLWADDKEHERTSRPLSTGRRAMGRSSAPATAGAETYVTARHRRAVCPAARPRSGLIAGRAPAPHTGTPAVHEPLRLEALNAPATGHHYENGEPRPIWRMCPATRAPSTGRPWQPMAWTSPSCAQATAATPRARSTPTSASPRTSTAPRLPASPRASTSRAVTPDEAREEADFVLALGPGALDLPGSPSTMSLSRRNWPRTHISAGTELAACARAFW